MATSRVTISLRMRNRRYLIWKRICFLVLCTGALLACIAILIYRPKMVQRFVDRIRSEHNILDKEAMSSWLVEQKNQYTAILNYYTVINLANAFTALLDIDPGNFLVKFAFVVFLYLSLACECTLLYKVPYIRSDDIFAIGHYVMVGELFFAGLIMVVILLSHNSYFKLLNGREQGDSRRKSISSSRGSLLSNESTLVKDAEKDGAVKLIVNQNIENQPTSTTEKVALSTLASDAPLIQAIGDNSEQMEAVNAVDQGNGTISVD